LPHAHFPFLHRLQQGRLRLGRGAVDFVGQQDVGEDRPVDEAEVPPPLLVFLQHVRAGDVRGHQVGRELDPLELDVQDPRQRADDQRLGQPGHAHVRLADDDLLQFLLHQPPVLAELLQDVAETTRLGGQGETAF